MPHKIYTWFCWVMFHLVLAIPQLSGWFIGFIGPCYEDFIITDETMLKWSWRIWVNHLLPNHSKTQQHGNCFLNSIWWHKTGSTLVQAMACCLMAPSHYLNQCWLIISDVQWQSPEGNFTEIHQPPTTKFSFKINHLKLHSSLPEANELTLVMYSKWCRSSPTFVQICSLLLLIITEHAMQ